MVKYFEAPMKPEQRQDRILSALAEHRRLGVDQLANSLSVSAETIRRDLSLLARRGLLRKVHGGAALIESSGEGSFQSRLGQQTAGKRRIARKAASLFGAGDTLFVDNGTTTLAFAEELATVAGVTVVTNGCHIAAAMNRPSRLGSHQRRSSVFLLGGSFVADGAEAVGAMTHEQIRRFHAEHAVLTIGALDVARGAMDYDLGETDVARAMIEQARQLTIVADRSKLGRTALFEVCPLASIDRLITDAQPEGTLLDALLTAGVEVLTAQ
jgi:DeoR family glycerol-3-phosphate regulon repressor